MGLFADGVCRRATGAVAVWLALLILASFPGIGIADPRTNDEAVIRAFHRRVTEIKRSLASEQPPAASEPARSGQEKPDRKESTVPPPPGSARPSTPVALKPSPITARDGQALSLDKSSLNESSRNERLPAAAADLRQDLERLQVQDLLNERRLQTLEGETDTLRTLAVFNLVLLAAISAGGAFLLRRHRRKRVTEIAEPLPAPPRTDALQEGIACYRAGRLEEALTQLNRALAQDASLVPAYLWRGNLFFRLRQFGRAHHDYLRMFQLDPENRSALLSIVELYLTAGQYALALEVLELGAVHRRGPEAEALFSFFEFAACTMTGLETAEAEARFCRAMEEDFILTWSLREIVRWLQSPELPQNARMKISALVRQLQTRGGRLTGFEPDSGDGAAGRGEKQATG